MFEQRLFIVTQNPESLPAGLISLFKRSEYGLSVFRDEVELSRSCREIPPTAVLIAGDFSAYRQLTILTSVFEAVGGTPVATMLLTNVMNEVHIHHAFSLGAHEVLGSQATATEIVVKLNRLVKQQNWEDKFAALPATVSNLKEYTVLKELSGGDQSRVFLATANSAQKNRERVVIKVFQPSGPHVASQFMRFRREITVLSLLKHPGIVNIRQAWQSDRVYFYSMDFIDGETLEQQLRSSKFRQPENVLKLMLAILEAAYYCHSQGVIHRDLKPGNIIINRSGQPKLIDFGFARIDQDHQITSSDVLLGTPIYFAPETITTMQYSPQTDLFALGLIMLQLLSRRTPVPTDNMIKAMSTLKHGTYLKANQCSNIDRPLALIVDKMIAHDPAKRFTNCLEARMAIAAYLKHTQSQTTSQRWRHDDSDNIRPRAQRTKSRRRPTNSAPAGNAGAHA